MYKNVGTRLPEEMAKDIEYFAEEEKVDKSKILRDLLAHAIKEKLIDYAMKKYEKREVSLGRAAEIARVPLVIFMKMAAERKITINYSVEWLKEDIKAAIRDSKK